MKNNKIKIGIIGLGLIGGSILKGLVKNSSYEIYSYSSTAHKTNAPLEKFFECDIVFVCSKLSKTLVALDKLNKILNKNNLVVDVASIKEKKYKKYNFNFLLSHPMAGKEKSGYEASCADLFKGAKWLVEKNNKILNKIIKDLGAKPYLIDMKKHNQLCAQISHFPAVLSYLVYELADDEAKKIASSGFRDMTRLACCDCDLTFNMYKNNEKNILKLFKDLTKKLNMLKKMSDDEKIKLFQDISNKRIKMYDKSGRNIL